MSTTTKTKKRKISQTLLCFAWEDLELAKEYGSVAVYDTKLGVIWINHEDGKFHADDNDGETHVSEMNEDDMTRWLACQYKVG